MAAVSVISTVTRSPTPSCALSIATNAAHQSESTAEGAETFRLARSCDAAIKQPHEAQSLSERHHVIDRQHGAIRTLDAHETFEKCELPRPNGDDRLIREKDPPVIERADDRVGR